MEEEKNSDDRGSTRRKPTSSPRTAIFLPNAALGDGKVRGLGDSVAWNHAAWGGHEAQGQPGEELTEDTSPGCQEPGQEGREGGLHTESRTSMAPSEHTQGAFDPVGSLSGHLGPGKCHVCVLGMLGQSNRPLQQHRSQHRRLQRLLV